MGMLMFKVGITMLKITAVMLIVGTLAFRVTVLGFSVRRLPSIIRILRSVIGPEEYRARVLLLVAEQKWNRQDMRKTPQVSNLIMSFCEWKARGHFFLAQEA